MNHIARPLLCVAAILALSGAAIGQSTPASPEPIDATSNTIVSASSEWSISSTQDGRNFKIDGKDGEVSAEIDGKPVPADRIVQEGDIIRIKDDKGETIFQTMSPGNSSRIFTATAPGLGGSLFGRAGSRLLGGPRDQTIRLQHAATPPVMIGIQLLEPDASIRGHLGLKENESTMVGAVYEGLPAATAGLEPYDIIVAIDGKSPASPAAVRKALRDTAAGKNVSLKVLHRGQEKTVSVTPEKYDHDKLDKAKINAIAASTGTPSAAALAGNLDPDFDKWTQSFSGSAPGASGQPFIATIPGQGSRPLTLWSTTPFNNAGGGQNMNDFAQRMQEMAAQMQAQAEATRRDAERLHEQMRSQSGNALIPGMPAPQFDDRMKKMEEMLQKLMEQREKKAEEKKTDARS